MIRPLKSVAAGCLGAIRRPGAWLTVLLACSLAGCALGGGGRHFSHMDETLDINILPDSSKQFVYRLQLQGRPEPDNPRVHRSPADRNYSQRGMVEPTDANYRRLQQNAERAVARAGYCRRGYMELDYRLSYHQLWLRGECREGASAEDLERFGDVQTLRPGR